jgi:uncharacterized protein (DUF736 family)
MSTIGKIQRRATKSGDLWEGYVSTLIYNFRFRLVPAPNSSNPNAPKYHVVTRNNAGIDVVIGAAWVKTTKRGKNEGEDFFTLTFDDPSFPKPLNVAAFKNPDTADYDISFRRRQDKGG